MKGTQQKMTAQFKMCHTPEKSLKHETFQKFSKLFMKTSVLKFDNKTHHDYHSRHEISGHSQGSSLSHGSVEDLISTLRQDRRQGTRKETLTKKGHESLQMTHNHFCETLGNSPDPTSLAVWEH